MERTNKQRFVVLRWIGYLLTNAVLIFGFWFLGAWVGIWMDPEGESMGIIFTAFAGMMIGVWLSMSTGRLFFPEK